MNTLRFDYYLRLSRMAALGAALAICSTAAWSQAAAAANAADKPQRVKVDPPPDPDDPRDGVAADVGPPVAFDPPDRQAREHKDKANHSHQRSLGPVALPRVESRPQPPVTQIMSERDKKEKKDKKG